MIILALLKRPVENGGVLAVFLEEKGKLRNCAKPCITRNTLTTFVVLGPNGLTDVIAHYVLCIILAIAHVCMYRG